MFISQDAENTKAGMSMKGRYMAGKCEKCRRMSEMIVAEAEGWTTVVWDAIRI
jgi:hypothetical protein